MKTYMDIDLMIKEEQLIKTVLLYIIVHKLQMDKIFLFMTMMEILQDIKEWGNQQTTNSVRTLPINPEKTTNTNLKKV